MNESIYRQTFSLDFAIIAQLRNCLFSFWIMDFFSFMFLYKTLGIYSNDAKIREDHTCLYREVMRAHVEKKFLLKAVFEKHCEILHGFGMPAFSMFLFVWASQAA